MLDKKQVKIDGSGNITAIGNITLTIPIPLSDFDEVISERLKERINILDERVVTNFGSSIHVARIGKEAKFSSDSILISLGYIGIPAHVSFDVVEHAVDNLISNKTEIGSKLSTTDVRYAISNALYNLDSGGYSTDLIQAWGDSYVRRYGNPDQRILVIDRAGELKDLDYRFIRDILLGDLISEIVGCVRAGKIKAHIRKKQIELMANEILEKVRGLIVYRIHYSTLLALSKELALQPPHPWFSARAFINTSIKYDFEKTVAHYKGIEKRRKNNKKRCILHIKEFLHHSCSSILGYYGVYMGCGHMAPLHNLKQLIKDLDSNYDDIMLAYGEVEIFKNDLVKNNYSLSDVSSILKRIIQGLKSNYLNNEDQYESLIDSLSDLYDLSNSLLFCHVKRLQLSTMANTPVESKQQFHHALSVLINLFPYLEWEWHIKGESFWLIHNFKNGIFNEVKSHILLAPIWMNERSVDEFLMTIGNNEMVCNCLFVITLNEVEENERQKITNTEYLNGVMVTFFKLNELIKIALEESPMRAIEKKVRTSILVN